MKILLIVSILTFISTNSSKDNYEIFNNINIEEIEMSCGANATYSHLGPGSIGGYCWQAQIWKVQYFGSDDYPLTWTPNLSPSQYTILETNEEDGFIKIELYHCGYPTITVTNACNASATVTIPMNGYCC